MSPALDDGASPQGTSLARAARAVLILAGSVSLALLAFAVVKFNASFALRPVGWYLAFTLGGLAFYWSAFRLKLIARITTAVACVVVLILLYGSEATLGVAALMHQSQVRRDLSERTGVPVDQRSVFEVVQNLRETSLSAVPSVGPTIIIGQLDAAAKVPVPWTRPFLPLSGVSQRLTVHLCNEDGRHHTYTADEYGFANPPGSWREGGANVALVGDSYTHGHCVEVEQNYPSRVRARWPSTLNLGIGGDGPLAELATLTEYAATRRPVNVVWQYYENDLSDLARERHVPLLMRYLKRGFTQGLPAKQADIDAALAPWVDSLWAAGRGFEINVTFRLREVLTLFHLRELSAAVLNQLGHHGLEDELPLFRAILQEAQARVREWGGRLYFVYVPSWERYYQPRALIGHDTRGSVLEIARSLGLSIVDLDPAILADPNRARLFARHELAAAHFSPSGYELLAREVIRAIEQDHRSGPAGGDRESTPRGERSR